MTYASNAPNKMDRATLKLQLKQKREILRLLYSVLNISFNVVFRHNLYDDKKRDSMYIMSMLSCIVGADLR